MRWPGTRWAAAVSLCLALATGGPTASAQTSSPDADPELAAALAAAELMNLAPPGVRETCMPASTSDGLALEGMLAAAQCLADAGLVMYVRFDDQTHLHAGYDALASLTGLAPETGTACRDGAFEGQYTAADGSVGGRLVCQLGPDGPMALWVDDERLVLGIVQVMGGTDFGVLEAAWQGVRVDAAPVAGSGAEEGPAGSPAPGSPATAVPPPPVVGPVTGTRVNQWATGAMASSQYGAEDWSATQATGPPDTVDYGDRPTAWAPGVQDGGPEWIELTFATAVVPTKVLVWETSGNGFVRSIEAFDEALGWVMLWEGTDDSPAVRYGFSPALAPTDLPTDRLRITIDTAAPGWNEIDSVELSGLAPDPS